MYEGTNIIGQGILSTYLAMVQIQMEQIRIMLQEEVDLR